MNLLSRVLRRLAQTSLLLTFVVVGAVASAQTVTYFHNDAFGTPVLATDANGNVVWKENYRPYGERMNNPPAEAGNAIGFTGKPFDPSTGLSYMGARYYNPVLGRFMGVDPAPGNVGDLHSFNRYAYANNNPYKFVDPDGRSPALAIEVGVPLLIGGAIYYATQTPERQQAMRTSLGRFFDNLTRSEAPGGQGQKQDVASGADKPVRDVVVPSDKYPESAGHIQDAQNNGQPDVLTVDRGGARGRRADAMNGQPTVPGQDRDEYPPAMFGEGGKGASVRPISPTDNRGAGACIGAQCRDLPDGSRVRIVPR